MWVFPPAPAWLPPIEDKHGQNLCWAARKHENQPSWIIESWYPNSYIIIKSWQFQIPTMFYIWSYDLVYTTWWFRQLSIWKPFREKHCSLEPFEGWSAEVISTAIICRCCQSRENIKLKPKCPAGFRLGFQKIYYMHLFHVGRAQSEGRLCKYSFIWCVWNWQ